MSAFDDFKKDRVAALEVSKELTNYIAQNLIGIFKDLGGEATNILTALDKQTAVNEELITSYKALAASTLILEQRNKQINKSFGVGVKQAAMLSETFQKVAAQLNISGEQTAKYGGSIRKMLPTLNQFKSANVDFYKGMQQTQHILQTNLGLTEDQANAYTQYAMQNGDSASSMLKATQAMAKSLDPDGTMGYFKTITDAIAGTSEEIQLQYGKIPGSLEMAVLKAKRLGFELEDLAGAADSLLEIESSIGNELEYQLLSGHRLVDAQGNSLTNMYREAALRGDMNKQADILNNILENEGDVLENNLFARKQMAATLGIEEKQLASALQKKKILDKAAAAGVEINLDGSDAMAQAAAALDANAISDEDFEALKEASDTRTTDDILDQILTVITEQKMLDTLMYNQAVLTNENQQAILETGKDKLSARMLGLSESALGAAGKVINVTRTIGSAATEVADLYEQIFGETATAGSSFTTKAATTKTDLSSATGFAEGGIVTSPTFAQIGEGRYNEAVVPLPDGRSIPVQMTGGGGSTPDMAQFAAMIVTAINNQTRALKSDATFSGGTLNAPYYG